jgi:hypothetical protein
MFYFSYFNLYASSILAFFYAASSYFVGELTFGVFSSTTSITSKVSEADSSS